MSSAIDLAALDPRFVNGERTIAVSDPATAASAGTYFISRFLNLPHGIYNIKWISFGSAILRIGKTQGAMSDVLLSSNGVLHNTQIYIEGGTTRFDIELAAIGGGSAAGIVFLIYSPDKVIYASNAGGWKFDTAPMSDNSLTQAEDPRLSLPVWSVFPNWKDGISEAVEYLTDITTSETGEIQTRSLREFPRRSFDISFMREGVSRARLDSFFLGVGKKRLLLPLWHEQYRPLGGLLQGQTSVSFPGDTLWMREFRVDDVVFISAGDPNDYELLIIASLDLPTDTVTFKSPASKDWSLGCRVVPTRIATVGDKSSISNITDRVGETQARFNIEEPDAGFGESWGYCSPLWRFPVDWANPIDVDHERMTYTFDNATGLPSTVDPGDKATVLTRAQATFFGREAMWKLRRFVQASRGRAKRFWMPSLTYDLIPTGPISGLFVSCRQTGITEYMLTQQSARMFIGVRYSDGSNPVYRQIVAIQRLSDSDVYQLDAPMPAAQPDEIERIEFVMPTRFDQDRFEFKHVVDDLAVVRAGFAFRSADHEGMALLNCGATTWTYPVLATDGLDCYGVVAGIRFGGINDITEGLDVAAAVVGLSYPTTVIYTTLEPTQEDLDVAGSVVAISYPQTVVYSTYDIGNEELDAFGSVAAVAFPVTVGYISYDIGSEALNLSGSVAAIALI